MYLLGGCFVITCCLGLSGNPLVRLMALKTGADMAVLALCFVKIPAGGDVYGQAVAWIVAGLLNIFVFTQVFSAAKSYSKREKQAENV